MECSDTDLERLVVEEVRSSIAEMTEERLTGSNSSTQTFSFVNKHAQRRAQRLATIGPWKSWMKHFFILSTVRTRLFSNSTRPIRQFPSPKQHFSFSHSFLRSLSSSRTDMSDSESSQGFQLDSDGDSEVYIQPTKSATAKRAPVPKKASAAATKTTKPAKASSPGDQADVRRLQRKPSRRRPPSAQRKHQTDRSRKVKMTTLPYSPLLPKRDLRMMRSRSLLRRKRQQVQRRMLVRCIKRFALDFKSDYELTISALPIGTRFEASGYLHRFGRSCHPADVGFRFNHQHDGQQVGEDTSTCYLTCRNTTFVPGFFKIFDEILVNAADNKVS